MKHNRLTKKSVAPNINVTPLIDILLVLLIIFMVITPLKPTRFKASIPEPPIDDPDIHTSARTLLVSVEPDLSVKLIRGLSVVAEGSIADSSPVVARLAEEWAGRRAAASWKVGLEMRADLPPDERIERTVFVRAPRSLPYGEIAKVIDGIKGAGAQPIGLQTDELPN